MLMRYKTLYGYIIRCESSYFCPLQTDFQRLVNFVKWRRHVIGSYCYFHFKIKDSDWSGYPTSHFVTMRQFCSDYLKAKSGKERLINMSHFFYFLSRFMDIMTVHRRYLCTRAEE